MYRIIYGYYWRSFMLITFGVKGLILVYVTFNRKALLRNKRNQRKRKQKVKRKRNIRNTRNMGARNTNISVQNTRNTKTRTSHLGLVVTYALTLRLKRNFQLSIESRPEYCIGFGFFRSVIGLKTNSCHSLNQTDAKLKPITNWTPVLSRAFDSLFD